MSTLALAVLLAAQVVLHAVPAPDEEFCTECCSLYCAALPKIMTSPGTAQAIGDGDTKSAWTVRHDTHEWFEFAFFAFRSDAPLKSTMGVDTLYILAGHVDEGMARPSELELRVDGVPAGTIRLLNSDKPQRIALPKIPLHEGLRVAFRVLAVFPGAGEQVAIREVRIDGYGHH